VNKKLLIINLIGFAILMGCKKDGSSVEPEQGKDDEAFSLYTTHYLDALWKADPDRATNAGYHKYDSLLVIPNDKSRDKQISFGKLQMDSMSRFEVNELSEANRMDYHLMQNDIDATQWHIQVLKQYQWDPTVYNVTGTFAYILNEHYSPLAKRLRNFYERMANIPAYYKEAEKQIKNPVAELTALAVEQHLGGINVFEKDFADSLKKTNTPVPLQKQMLDRAHLSAEAIKGFAAWLKAFKNDHPRSFRLGKELYEDKFKTELQAAYNAQQIFNSAMERKKYLHREMAKISRQLWTKYFVDKLMPADSMELISKVIDTLSANHVEPGDLQSAIERQLPTLSTFITSKDILTIDLFKPVIVRREPDYMATGAAGASVSTPGPYEKNGNIYYNVGSLAGWSKEKAESYLREYNHYTLQILNIHEAIPGHYTQALYARKSPSLIKSIFANMEMMEGWAVYAEQMMIDNGYGNSEPEMKLMWYKWHLRSVYNTILDYSVHTSGMTKEQAIKMLTHDAFQQQTEAENKWKCVTISSVQLDSYYTGYKEISDLREAYKKKAGAAYSLREFNEKFLSYGNSPVKYIKEAMMGKGSKKD